jgi:divalent metal cation (Fe/Co/Zn/Cd) transporter
VVIFTGLRVLRDTSLDLADTMPDRHLLEQIRAVALRVPGVVGVEKCFARKTGLQHHVDLHLEVDPDITVRESHEIATRARIQLREQLDWIADVLVHIEPAASATALRGAASAKVDGGHREASLSHERSSSPAACPRPEKPTT